MISIITLINRMGTMVIPFLAVYLTTVLGYSLSTAGYIVGAFGLGSILGSYVGGKLSDMFNPNMVMVGSLISSGLAFIAMQFFTEQYALMSTVFITACLADAFRPVMSAFVAHHAPQTAGRSMALIRIAINLGMALGPALGGFIAFHLGYRALFWMDGLTCIAAGLMLLLVMYQWNLQSRNTLEEEASQDQSIEVPPFYKNKAYVNMLVVSLLTAIAFVQYFHTVPVFIKTVWGFDERYLGAMMAVNCLLIVALEMPIVDTQERKGNSIRVMLLGLLLFLGAFLPFLGPSSIWLYLISILFFTAGEILFLPFNTAYAINLSPEIGRGAYMSWYWIVWGIANVVAPVIGFQLIETLGYSTFWIIICLILGIAALLHKRSMEKGI